jgi:RNA polymerase sigma-70 factor (ECF subfamily)
LPSKRTFSYSGNYQQMADYEPPGDSNKLVERARAGDPQAVASLLGLYRNYLHLLARVHIDSHLQAKADPSDLVQETCLMAARDLPQFRGTTEAEFVAWMRQIMANAGAAMIRRFKGTQTRNVAREELLERKLEQSSIALERLITEPESSPSRIASRREAAVVLADALAKLPEEYRDVIVLFHLEGLSLADIATRMGRTPASIRGLRTRAILKLRTIMKESA